MQGGSLLAYAAFPINGNRSNVPSSLASEIREPSSVSSATFRVPRPSGDGYRSALPLATEGTQECRGRFVGEVLHKCYLFISMMSADGRASFSCFMRANVF